MGICRKELLFTFILTLGSLTFGYVMGYYSPAHVSMVDKWGDVVSNTTYDWFNSVTSLTAIAGPFIANGLLTPHLPFGRKVSVFIIALAGTAFWLLFLGVNPDHIWLGIVARGLLGLIIGAFSALIPMYIIELVPQNETGFFGTIPQVCVSSGFVVVFLFSQWMDWEKVAICGAAITGALALFIWVVPQRLTEASEKKESPFTRGNAGRLIVGSLLSLFQQLSGINAILTNLTDLFKNANIPMKPNYASALCSTAQVIASAVASILIQKFGRKIIWVISFGGIAITDVLYGLTEVQKFKDANTFGRTFPIVVIFLNLLSFGTGAGPIPWFIVPEMFEQETDQMRASATSFVSSLNWIFAFGVVRLFPYMKEGMGLGGSFFFFGAASTIATVFGIFYVKRDSQVQQKDPTITTDQLYTSDHFE